MISGHSSVRLSICPRALAHSSVMGERAGCLGVPEGAEALACKSRHVAHALPCRDQRSHVRCEQVASISLYFPGTLGTESPTSPPSTPIFCSLIQSRYLMA